MNEQHLAFLKQAVGHRHALLMMGNMMRLTLTAGLNLMGGESRAVNDEIIATMGTLTDDQMIALVKEGVSGLIRHVEFDMEEID